MILPGATLGLLGGGQLGRMFTLAARRLGYRVIVLDPDADGPAAQVADVTLVADYGNADALNQLAARCVAITSEFENVPAASLERLAHQRPVRPGAEAVAIAQDRIREKHFLRRNDFPLGTYIVVSGAPPVDPPAGLFPGVLKRARFGYDGKGQVGVATADALPAAFAELGAVPCVLEQRLDLAIEISVIVARGSDGDMAVYPLAENCHRHGILDITRVPAAVDALVAHDAAGIACAIADALEYVGVLTVEFFVTRDGRLLVNEIAPRPHNSGHYTLDACVTSQFEQQVRAVCGLPLGDPHLLTPAAMVNLLGDIWQAGTPAWDAVLGIAGAKLHLYGKRAARPGRKMGHVTCLAADVASADAQAAAVKRILNIP